MWSLFPQSVAKYSRIWWEDYACKRWWHTGNQTAKVFHGQNWLTDGYEKSSNYQNIVRCLTTQNTPTDNTTSNSSPQRNSLVRKRSHKVCPRCYRVTLRVCDQATTFFHQKPTTGAQGIQTEMQEKHPVKDGANIGQVSEGGRQDDGMHKTKMEEGHQGKDKRQLLHL